MRRRYVHGLQLRGVYTWSRNLDDGSAWNTSVSRIRRHMSLIPGNPKVDYGVAATNISHAAAINGTWELPLGKGTRGLPMGRCLRGRLRRRMEPERHCDTAKRLSVLSAIGLQPDG